MDSDLELLKEHFGGWWCGIRFGKTDRPEKRPASSPMRFCEAVASSRTGPITLRPETLDCPGGSRCLGWGSDDDKIARMMAEKGSLDPETARRILDNTPRLQDKPEEVTLGTFESPDVVLSYLQPDAVMHLVRQWQIHENGRPVQVEISGFLSVCGALAVKAFLTNRICISFGCLDAREFGCITRDRLVVGLPVEMVHKIVETLKG
ncbi:MAG: DUF169 domain-containing protein [Proteobacteria bacterium]|nr:DUF169 domain-containing protein [Pseudomonadota bacterium]